MPKGVYERQPRPLKPIADRFWAKVQKGDGCWVWQGSVDTGGYGHLGREDRSGLLVRASRVSWEMHHGPIPAGRWVLHHCDNPPCVRPDHLYLGDAKANGRDMALRNRAYRGGAGTPTRGTLHSSAKLTERQVAEMRRTYTGRSGEQSEIARRYGVDKSTISKIVNGHGWPHV